jgi:hypothetical protein
MPGERRVDLLRDASDFRALMENDLTVWRADWAEASPWRRRRLIVQHRRRLLTATPEGRARLRRWLDEDVPWPPMPRHELEALVRYRLALFGDEGFLPDVIGGLMLLPDPLRTHALKAAAFVCVGRQSRAWTASARLEDRDGPRPRMVVLGPDADVRTVIHECVHVWHTPGGLTHNPQDPAPAVTAAGAIAIRQLAREGGWLAGPTADYRRHERLAEAGAIAWL